MGVTSGSTTPVTPPHSVQGFTVTCQQCGAANMTRLDRKEYKCNHCGAVTVISDTDAEHLEQLLKQMIGRQVVQTAPPAPASTGKAVALTVGVLVFVAALVSLLALSPHHAAPPTTSVDSYFARTTVPVDRIAMSPLEWVPDRSGGTYNGLIYNHSGYAIMPPSYGLALFHNDVKDDQSSSNSLLGILEPGEYMPVSFRVEKAKPNARYEVVQPARIDKGMFEVAPVKLRQPTLVRLPTLPHYYLVGYVDNTSKRPFYGGGMVMLYDKQGRLIGSGVGNIGSADLNPGETTKIAINGFLFHEDAEVASYEYLMDFWYKNERQSMSMQDMEKLQSATVHNRIVRVDHPQLLIAPDSSNFDPLDVLRGQ